MGARIKRIVSIFGGYRLFSSQIAAFSVHFHAAVSCALKKNILALLFVELNKQ